MNLSNFSQIRYNGKDITLAKLNGDILYELNTGSVRLVYTIKDPSNLHTFNSEFEYTMKTEYNSTDDYYTVSILSENTFTKFNCNVETLSLEYADISNVTDMNNMFYNCTKLTSLDLSSWDTSNVTNMRGMFNNCTGLTSLNLEGWDLRKANTQTMLAGCTSLTDLNVKNWKCGDLLGCFINCSSLQSIDLSGWDTSNTKSMQQLFYNCNKLEGISGYTEIDTSNVTNMYGLFAYTGFGSLDVITNILRYWDTSKVTNMAHMFEGCYWHTIGTNRFEHINTSSVTDMSCMFSDVQTNYGIYVETDTSNVTDMSYMFSGCGASVECYFGPSGDCSHMFENFSGSITSLWGGSPTNASYMFASSNIDDSAFSSYIYYIDLQNCQNTSYMFYNCQNIYNLSFSDSTYHNMYNLYEAAYMFADCFNLTQIEIPYMSTSYLWNYENMFYNVPDYCNIKIDRSLFYLDESSTGFGGYFQDY